MTLAGGSVSVSGAADPAARLTRVGRIRPSGPRFSMRTSPMAWVQLGEPTLLTLGGRWATMAAVAGEVAQLELNVDVGGLRGSSGYKK
jgi:hypothetical protein